MCVGCFNEAHDESRSLSRGCNVLIVIDTRTRLLQSLICVCVCERVYNKTLHNQYDTNADFCWLAVCVRVVVINLSTRTTIYHRTGQCARMAAFRIKTCSFYIVLESNACTIHFRVIVKIDMYFCTRVHHHSVVDDVCFAADQSYLSLSLAVFAFLVWYAANADIIAVLKGSVWLHGISWRTHKYQKKYQTKTIKSNENTTHNIRQKTVKLNSSLRTFKVVKCRWNCE